jgi:hypothetical protein
MRDRQELLFRLRQETANLRLFLAGVRHTPGIPAEGPLPLLPDPEAVAARLRNSGYSEAVVRIAGQVLQHQFPLLTLTVSTGPSIDWQSDPAHPERNGLGWRRRALSRLIPYMAAGRFGDYKIIWELNRHQHLPLLAEAWLLTGRREYLEEIERQLQGWRAANRPGAGMNWASALEVAFRALSWIWTWHLASGSLSAETRTLLVHGLEEHARFLEYNLSFYHSPNTHLIGEALALEATGVLFPHFRKARDWSAQGGAILDAELDRQVRADGGHFEQSTYYHVYTLDMFLFHGLLAQRHDRAFLERLRQMARYLAALAGPAGRIPLIGDDDGGRFFHPYGNRQEFCRATLATCGVLLDEPQWVFSEENLAEQAVWWVGTGAFETKRASAAVASTLFPDTGIAVLAAGDRQIVMDVGPFGPGNAGHSHADTLSVVVSAGDEQLLVDPGTYTYILDREDRDRFRGTAAHNTIRIDGRDQALPVNPFRWAAVPDVRILQWQSTRARDFISAACRYAGFCHTRAVLFAKPDVLLIADWITGAGGEHTLEQFWHAGAALRLSGNRLLVGTSASLLIAPAAPITIEEGGEFGWRSPGLGTRYPSPVARITDRRGLPALRWTVIDLGATTGELLVDGPRAFYRRDSFSISAETGEDGQIKVLP